jgi:predicted nucleotidyltransferase component of viral defense system
MIKHWIDSYKPRNLQESEQAFREIMQEITLAALYRSNFFKYAAFYGGTALRIFHGLDRFSEDLDFTLLEKNTDFNLDPYFKAVIEEFEALGIKVSINKKQKSVTSSIDSAFLKAETLWSELIFVNTIPQLNFTLKPIFKIKIEVDTNPPLNFTTENLLLTKPFSFYVNCLTLPDLFAGKMHALLFRKWINRVKGRDLYDLEWYLKMGVQINLKHFYQRALESEDWKAASINKTELLVQ